jgi:hypothetical protein
LVGGGVDFVVIGGFAAITHGSARVTKDLDICFARDGDNLERLAAALLDLRASLRGAPADLPFSPDAGTLRRVEVLTLETAEGPLDVMTAPAGSPSYAMLRRHALEVEVAGVPVRVASLEDLIAMKQAAGRAQDLADLEVLEAIRQVRDAD